jgi:hypothetical protein
MSTEKNPLISQKTFHLKNGDIVIKEYDQRKYNATWYQKHKDTVTARITCFCGGRYMVPNLSRHSQTSKHKNYKPLAII